MKTSTTEQAVEEISSREAILPPNVRELRQKLGQMHQLSKRQFLKLSLGGTAACVLAPLLKPGSLFANPAAIPATYLESAVHSYWMRLSYNGKRESRKVRRTVGTLLRNIGAAKGRSGGFDFTLAFDRAVEAAFVRWVRTRQKPASLFGLAAMLYDDFIYPGMGPDGGRAMFGTLLGVLRGRDGTKRGMEVYQAYLTYRQFALQYKYAARIEKDPAVVEESRQSRKTALETWRGEFLSLVNDYATKQIRLDDGFIVSDDLLEGFRIRVKPAHPDAAHLTIQRSGNRLIIRWKGEEFLQEATGPTGPWMRLRKAPPAGLDPDGSRKFFRAIHQSGALP